MKNGLQAASLRRRPQPADKARFKKWKTGYKPEQERKGGGHEPLDVLNSGGQEGLFAHIPGQCSKFSVNARSGARKGFPEPEVSGCEHAPTQPPRQRLGLGRLPGKC